MDESSFTVVVEGGRPWGFTLQGGLEFRAPLRVGKVTPGGKAEKAGLIPGDYITSINNTEVKGLKHFDAKQLVINSSSTLQLLCTKTPPVGLFSPAGNKPTPQFYFTSPRSPSPSLGSRPRASSFTSLNAQARPRTSSFTSPTSSARTSPSPSSSAGKSLSLRRPPPPAVVATKTTPTRGHKSDTLPNGRPRPPVNYQGDIANSSSGVSSSVSSVASSPPPPHPNGGPLQYSPVRHLVKGEPTPVQISNHTVSPADTAEATVNTAEMIPSTVETADIPENTAEVAMIPAGEAMIPADTKDDIIPITSPTGTADIMFVSDENGAISAEPFTCTSADPVDTANAMTDPGETANFAADQVEIPADQAGSTDQMDTTDTTAANPVDLSTDQVNTANAMTDPGETANFAVEQVEIPADQVDSTDPIDVTDTNPVDLSTDQVNTTNAMTDPGETAADQVEIPANQADSTTNTITTNPVHLSTDQVDTVDVSTDPPDATITTTIDTEGPLGEKDKEENGEQTTVPETKEEEREKGPVVAASGGEVERKVEEDEEEKEGKPTAVAGDELTSAVDPSSGQHEPQTSIDKQLKEARKAREAEMKARATSLLTGKLGSLVRSKPTRPVSAPISKPPLPPSASVAKPPRPPATVGPKSPQHVPLSPTGPLGVNRRDPPERRKEGAPVIRPYLVKKGEEKPTPQSSLPDRSMKDVKMAYRLSGWYKEMFQGFQQTVEELFSDSSSEAQHSRTISTPADMDTYVYDHRGLKVRKSSFSSSSSPVSPIHTRSHSGHTATHDPVYVYDHRGLRVRKDSLTASSSETNDHETTPTTVPDIQGEAVTTAAVLAASRRQYSMDSGYDDKGLRLREGSQGNGDTDDHEETSPTTTAGEEVTKDNVMDAVKKPTSYKSDKFSTEPSRTYWSAIDRQFAEDQRKKREAELQQEEEERDNHRASSEEPTPEQRMAHMHPLLTEGLEDVSTKPSGEVFDRIDAQKLAGALDNAKTLTTMEQEGVPSQMLPLNPQQREQSKEPEKLPPPGKKGRALYSFEGQREKELSFQKGAVIELLHTVNDNWLEGMVGQSKGIFPTSYIQVLSHQELRESLAKENAPLMTARATYDFQPQSDRELQFKKDDIIAITKKIDDNWFQGYLGDQKGIFPSSYVEILEATQ